MSYKITLIEYDEDIYEGDELEPQTQFKNLVIPSLGQTEVSAAVEINRKNLIIQSQIDELYNYLTGIALPLVLSAWWRFESDSSLDILEDSEGGNDLTSDSGNSPTPTESGGDYKEGLSAAEFDGISQGAGITDADLDTGFPLKDGDTTKNITVCFWLRLDSFTPLGNGNARLIFTKGIDDSSGASDKSFEISVYQTAGSNYLRLRLSSDGTSYDNSYIHTSALSTGVWYFIGVSYGTPVEEDSATEMECIIRIWDDDAQEILGTDFSEDDVITTHVGDGYLSIGLEDDSNQTIDGLLDDLRVYKDNLTINQMDAIRTEDDEEEE